MTIQKKKKKPVSIRGMARDFSFSLGNSEKLEASLEVWRSARREERFAAQIGQNL
jgi:hypothetical protein